MPLEDDVRLVICNRKNDDEDHVSKLDIMQQIIAVILEQSNGKLPNGLQTIDTYKKGALKSMKRLNDTVMRFL